MRTGRLMGAEEIRVRLGGISRSWVQQLTNRKGFPDPEDELAMGKVWRAEDVEAWIRANRPDLVNE